MPIYYPIDRIPSKWEKKNRVTLHACACINASGETALHLTDTKLWNSSLSPPNSIDHNTTDGTVEITFLPVGGIIISVNKLELLSPYLGLTILLAVAVVTVVYVKKRKRNRD